MKIHHVVVLVFLIKFCWTINHQPSVIQYKEEQGPGGIWKTKTQWKAHWVKHWETRKIWIPIWRKVWGPVETKEWVPLPKAHPTWSPPPPTWTTQPH